MHAVLKSAGDGLVASTPPELQPVGSDPIEGTAAGVKMGAGKGEEMRSSSQMEVPV